MLPALNTYMSATLYGGMVVCNTKTLSLRLLLLLLHIDIFVVVGKQEFVETLLFPLTVQNIVVICWRRLFPLFLFPEYYNSTTQVKQVSTAASAQTQRQQMEQHTWHGSTEELVLLIGKVDPHFGIAQHIHTYSYSGFATFLTM